MPTLDLTDDETRTLVTHLRHTRDYARYPLAPRLDPLKAILAKLDPPAPVEALPLPLPASAGPRVGRGKRKEPNLSNTRPKDQHVIPEMHLKHFVDAQGMVWTYHKTNGNISKAVPRETAFQRNFYTIEHEPGEYRDDLEGYLGLIESDAAPIYERLLLGEIPQGEDRGKFAWFIGTMYARTPGMIRMFAEVRGAGVGAVAAMMTTSREKFDKLIERTEKEGGFAPLDPLDRERMFELLSDPSKYKINVDRSAGLGALAISRGMAGIFYNMRWALLKPSDKSEFFITSDQPVARITPQRSPSFYGDGGFMNPNVQVTLPLSPDRLLILTWDARADIRSGPIPIQKSMVRIKNKQRALFAEAQVYADRRDAGIQALTEKYKEQHANIEISGFGADRQVKVIRKLKP
jgi:hypothetical protein